MPSSTYKIRKSIMTTAEIGILIWVVMLTLQVMQNMKRIDKMGWDMTRKMDKPPAETPMEEYDRKRKERVERLEKEERAKDVQ